MSFEHLTNSSTQDGKKGYLFGLFFALLLTGSLIYGFLRLRAQNNKSNTIQNTKPTPTPLPAPQVQVYEDEARLQGSSAILSGTIKNISTTSLNHLTAIVELSRRNQTQATEQRIITLRPDTLSSGQQAVYQLAVPWRDFSSVKLVAIKSNEQTICQPSTQKCVSAGKARAKETTPDSRPTIKKTVTLPAKPRRPSGDEIINTPETAAPY